MQRTALATLDWFIPNASMIERSEIGLARNFIITHLLGPFLIQSIVLSVYWADPDPGLPCYAMMVCVSAFWLLPFGLKLTRDLRMMALVSVELLCVTALIGTSFYGGVFSPFLTWLLVSLMLGFFYLSNQAFRVVGLFTFNIVVALTAHLLFRFPQHLSPAQLQSISWFSVFSATAYMSFMAIYYANIITMSSSLERETERHRLMAQRLRKAKQQAEAASHGKSVFLAKMYQQFEQPLINVVVSSESLIERLDRGRPGTSSKAEVERIKAAGLRLLDLVRETVDPKRMQAIDTRANVEEFAIADFVDGLASSARALVSSYGQVLVVEHAHDAGYARIDAVKLRQAMDILIAKAAAAAPPGNMLLSTHRDRTAAGDWIELEVRTAGSSKRSRPLRPNPAPASTAETAHEDAELELSEMHFAVLGGSLTTTRQPDGGWRFMARVPAFSDGA